MLRWPRSSGDLSFWFLAEFEMVPLLLASEAAEMTLSTAAQGIRYFFLLGAGEVVGDGGNLLVLLRPARISIVPPPSRSGSLPPQLFLQLGTRIDLGFD